MHVRRIASLAAATTSLSVVLMATSGASYAGNTDLVIGEGSVSDFQNILGASLSDATATGVSAQVLGASGCSSSATKPAARANNASPTKQEIFSVVKVSCANGSYNDTWELQRHRWYGWSGLGSSISGGGGGTFVWRGELSTFCRAGTWSYRTKARNYHTQSFRYSCVDVNNPTFVDLG